MCEIPIVVCEIPIVGVCEIPIVGVCEIPIVGVCETPIGAKKNGLHPP